MLFGSEEVLDGESIYRDKKLQTNINWTRRREKRWVQLCSV